MTSSLVGVLGSDWPGCEQVFRLTHKHTIKGKTETEVVFGITSLLPERAGVKGLLGLTRGHWGIENGLHGVRDGTLREDASRIRKGSGPEVMAALQNIVIFLFTRFGHKSARGRDPALRVPSRRNRWNSCQPQSENETALILLGRHWTWD